MPDSNVDDPSFGQPLCTALQLALTDLLSSWNIVPAAVIGHSSGEIAAAYVLPWKISDVLTGLFN
jgi:acyl transferase domain-containing protein